MSMGTDEIHAAEAAEILGVTTQRVYQMRRSGVLRAVGKVKEQLKFNLQEVCALAEAKEELGTEPLNAEELHWKLIAVLGSCRQLQRAVQGIEGMLGLTTTRVSNDKPEILSIVIQAEYALEEITTDVERVREWTRIFFGITEETFHLVELYTNNPEPWSLFLRLAQKMHKDCPRGGEVYNDKVVDPYLELLVAWRELRKTAWSYACQRCGSKFAQSKFPETETDPIKKLINCHLSPG